MTTLIPALLLLILVSMFGAAFATAFHRVTTYRVLAAVFLASLATYASLLYGFVGASVVLGTMLLAVPLVVWVATMAIVAFTWQSVRIQFPGQPKRAPVAPITLGSIYRTCWLA